MKYFKVKPEFDNRRKNANFDIYIGGELYTEKEVEKQNLNTNFMTIIEVSKNKTYWFFGARRIAE